MKKTYARRNMRTDGVLILFTRIIADKIADFLFLKSLLSPNQVSFVSLIFVIFSGVCASTGDYLYLIISAILFYFGFVLDCVDGELARLKKMDSNFGQWLDVTLGELGNIIFFVGCGIGLYKQTGELNSVWLLVLFLFLKYLYANILLNSHIQVGGHENFIKLATAPLHARFMDFFVKFKHLYKKYLSKKNTSKNNTLDINKKLPSIGLLVIIPVIFLLTNQLALIFWFFILFYAVLYFLILLQIYNSYKKL